MILRIHYQYKHSIQNIKTEYVFCFPNLNNHFNQKRLFELEFNQSRNLIVELICDQELFKHKQKVFKKQS